MTLPASLAQQIGLKPGDHLTFEDQGRDIVVRTYADVVREGQNAFQALIKRPFTVDDFVRERRAEAFDE